MSKPHTYTAQYLNKWYAGFNVGNQSFVLQAFEGTKEEAKGYAEMMEKAFAKLRVVEDVELKGNDYDCLLQCTGCKWRIGWHIEEDLEPMKFCPGCGNPIKR